MLHFQLHWTVESQFDFYFLLFQVMVVNVRQTKIQIKLVKNNIIMFGLSTELIGHHKEIQISKQWTTYSVILVMEVNIWKFIHLNCRRKNEYVNS